MSLIAVIRDYFAPLGFSARDHRQENLKRANDIAARELLMAERAYWRCKIQKAVTEQEVKRAREELDMLDELEASRG